MTNALDAMAHFNDVAIHHYIDPFFESDVEAFLHDATQFSLALKRSPSSVSLYGYEHVVRRQAIFNRQPLKDRRRMFLDKLCAANVDGWVSDHLGVDVALLDDVQDIGQGRSIYRFDGPNHPPMVIKEKANATQQLYHELADHFGVPRPDSHMALIQDQHWELTPFLVAQDPPSSDEWIRMHARAAAFGDFIVLGDRHVENYIPNGGELMAIDVAHMFEDDNDHWTKKYISGGLYECCVLQSFVNDPSQFDQYLVVFFQHYVDQASAWFHRQVTHPATPLTRHQPWVDDAQFIQHMDSIYRDALMTMLERRVYKVMLQSLVKHGVSLELYPELWMYYLADQHRSSVFFRLEDISTDVFAQIQQLAGDHLGVGPQYYRDHDAGVARIKQTLRQPLPVMVG